jgi:hypothetical protein
VPYVIVKGAVPPAGANVAWTATAIQADLIPGAGWVYEAPTYAELMAWAGAQARGFVVRHSPGTWDPSTVARAVRGTDWSAATAVAANAVSTIPQLKTAILTADSNAVTSQ